MDQSTEFQLSRKSLQDLNGRRDINDVPDGIKDCTKTCRDVQPSINIILLTIHSSSDCCTTSKHQN